MKKKKLELKQLKVKSFVTALETETTEEIKGGLMSRDDDNIISIEGMGKKRMIWTISEQRRGFYVAPNNFGGPKGGLVP